MCSSDLFQPNQIGLCVVLFPKEVANLFEDSRLILEETCGPYHPSMLAVYRNLVGTHEEMGK